MYEFSRNKNRLVNNLVILTGIYLLIKIIKSFNWAKIFLGDAYYYNNAAANTFSVINTAVTFLSTIIVIFIYWYMKKLRETPQTKKMYSALFWIVLVKTTLSVVEMLIFWVINYSTLDIFQIYHIESMLFIKIYQVYNYFWTFLPVPFMVAIFIKEKLNYNWMIIGILTSFYFSVLSMLARGIRNLFFDKGIMVNFTFNEKFPVLKLLADNPLLHTLRGDFWLIGLIALIVIYKMKFKKADGQADTDIEAQ